MIYFLRVIQLLYALSQLNEAITTSLLVDAAVEVTESCLQNTPLSPLSEPIRSPVGVYLINADLLNIISIFKVIRSKFN